MARFSKIIDSIANTARDKELFRAKTLRSLEWYRNRVENKFGNQKRFQLDFEKEFQGIKHPLELGWFFTFAYNPKTKEKLPYYDRYPLTMTLARHTDGFIGLNMHYLKPIDRAYFMDRLYNFEAIDPRYDTTKINITYEQLRASKRLQYYRPCIKKYLWTRIHSFFAPIYPAEWDVMLFLPTEKFIGAHKDDVWDDSRKLY